MAGRRVEAVCGALEADDGDEVARVVEDGGAEGGEVLFALAVCLAVALLFDDGDRALEGGGIGDRTRGVGDEVVGDLRLRAASEGEHDLADGRGVRDARSSDEGGGAHAASARDVVDRDRLAGRGEGQGRRLAALPLQPLEQGARNRPDVEAREDVGAELQETHPEAVTARIGHPLDQVVRGERAEEARRGGGGDAERSGDRVHALRLIRLREEIEDGERAFDCRHGSALCCHLGNGTPFPRIPVVAIASTLRGASGERWTAHALQAVRAVFLVAAPAAAGVTAGARAAGVSAAVVAFGLLLVDGRGSAALKPAQAAAVGVLIAVGLFIGGAAGGGLVSMLLVIAPVVFLLGLLRGLGHAAARISLAVLLGVLLGAGLASGALSALQHLGAGLIGIVFYLLIDRIWADHPVPDPQLQVARGEPVVSYAVLLAVATAVSLGLGFAIGLHEPVMLAVGAAFLVLAGTTTAPKGALAGVAIATAIGIAVVALRPDPRTVAIAMAVVIAAGVFRSADHRVPLWLPAGVLYALIALGT